MNNSLKFLTENKIIKLQDIDPINRKSSLKNQMIMLCNSELDEKID